METHTHPYLICDQEQLDRLKLRLAQDEALRTRYEALTSSAPALLEQAFLTEEYANSAYTQHGNYYEVGAQLSRMMNVLGTKWVIEQDEALSSKLRALMLHVCSFAAWTGPSNKDRDVPWHSDLSTTRIAVELAFGYDLLHEVLNEADRVLIANAIYRKGILPLLEDWVLPKTRIHALDSMGHNWWSVCISLAGVALLPLTDTLPKTEWRPLLDEINLALIGYLNYPGCTLYNKVPNYDEKGLFYESTGYFVYGTGELLRYLWHYERYFGRNESLRAAIPHGMTEALLSFAYPYLDGERERVAFLNFGDSALQVSAYAMLRYLTLLGMSTPATDACLARTVAGDDLLSLVAPTSLSPDWSVLPRTAFYPTSGYAITRSSWESNATLLAVKSGYTWNHAHADAGSFVLYSRGQALLFDSGSSAYSHKLYSTYFRKDDAHNVLLVDGEGQRSEEQIRGSKFPGSLSDTYEGKGLLYVQADATGPMSHRCSRMYRNFLWLDDSILVIVDDVLCHEPSTVQMLLHYNGDAQPLSREDGALSFDVLGERCAMRVVAAYPKDATLERQVGHLLPHKALFGVKGGGEEPQEIDYLSVNSSLRARVHHGISVLLLNERMEDTTVELIRESEVIGVKLTDQKSGLVRQVLFNERADGRRMHINANHTLASWDTDAYILMTETRGETTERIFMVSGSYLRRGESVLHASYRMETREIFPSDQERNTI